MKNIRVKVSVNLAPFCPIDKTKEKSTGGALVGFYEMPEILFSRNRTIDNVIDMSK